MTGEANNRSYSNHCKRPFSCRIVLRAEFKNDSIYRRKPGALHHLAFKANSCEEVDKLYLQIREIGAHIVESPKYFPQHGESYYALFFKDLEGIKYEIVYELKKEILPKTNP